MTTTVYVGGPTVTQTFTITVTRPPTVSFGLTVQDRNSPWGFVMGGQQNPDLKVSLGATVEIVLNNNGQIIHTWVLDANSPSPYDVSTTELDSGKSETILFVADKPGTFTYYCKIPGHRDLGMKGNFVVS